MTIVRLVAITWWFQLKQSTKAAAYVLLRVFEAEGRRRASLELV